MGQALMTEVQFVMSGGGREAFPLLQDGSIGHLEVTSQLQPHYHPSSGGWNAVIETIRRLIARDAPRTEADVQADIRSLLLSAPLQLHEGDLEIVLLESPLGDRRRIDVEVGSAVIEVKRDLRRGNTKEEARDQLSGYVETRAEQTGRRYVGILSDGAEWVCYDLRDDELEEVTSITVTSADQGDALLVWLEGVLATARDITPSPREIAGRLGAQSSAHDLDRATIAALYAANRDLPSIRMKRGLWSRLLTSTLGTQFEDSDDLFVEHTLLVNSAEIIAHSLLGINPESVEPAALLAGNVFEESGIYGVVEQDFFDWVAEVEDGARFVRALARRLSRFDWGSVDQDVLKVLYESVIGAETRKRLGEYYTPDWLAEIIVSEVVTDPVGTRVLDPACGSGTFLFHAVRRFLAAAEAAGNTISEALRSVSRHVQGMDLHPVAVTLARVTYLLAIGRERLTSQGRGPLFVPVYLGDSVQWGDQSTNLWNAGSLVVPVEDQAELFSSELRFPDVLLNDAAMFDDLVEAMADMAARRESGSRVPSLNPLFQRLGVPEQAKEAVRATFRTMCDLQDAGRNHIWSYYVRNLARPVWLARSANRVDALVGNPPWLAFRHMPEEMQRTFREMSEHRGLWAGAENATHQDLSALFVTRAVELYLAPGGRFGFVMPNAVVDRDHYAGFRTGHYAARTSSISIDFGPSWDLRRIRPHFFPRGSSVVFGRRAEESDAMPLEATIFSGRIPRGETSIAQVEPHLERQPGAVTISTGANSPYRSRFRQGATFSPRLCFFVERRAAGPLGAVAGLTPVVSSRSVNEKKPWKELPSIEGVVEDAFLRPMYSGESLLPFRVADPLLALVPAVEGRLLRTEDQMALYPGLADWWRKAESVWNDHRKNEDLDLIDRLDWHGELATQLPPPRLRVIYNTSGMHLAAAKLTDPRGVVNTKLYWCAARSEEEADYLCALLNSPVTTEFVRPLMSYGKDERDVHKHVWKLPIPEFDPANRALARLAELGALAERLAGEVQVDPDLHFATSRRRIREHLIENPDAGEIDDLVYELLS